MNYKILALVAIILGAAGIYYVTTSPSIPPWDEEPVACTADAKLCPDGSAVGRVGPNCEFAKCPNETPSTGKSGVRGVVLLGPQCPVVREGEECPDKPFATNLVLTTPDGARVIKQFVSTQDGTFSVDVPPGQYAVRSAAAANILPYCSSETIVVSANAYTNAAISCDTGIR